MSFINIAKNRYSCRNFLDKSISKEILEKIIEAARIAPSARNIQPWYFFVINDRNMLEKIYECYNRDWFKTAPVVIVACGNHSTSWKREDGKDHCDIDIAIAVDHITLAATDMGLGSCWVCRFDAKKCSQILNLPSYVEPIVLIPIGYPADKPDTKRHEFQRVKLSEITNWDYFK
jgi:nitroreductase